MRANTRTLMALPGVSEKKFLAALALATVGLMFAGEVAAKPSLCLKDCKQDIKDCLALVTKDKDCAGTKTEKKACRKMHTAERKTCHGFVKLCKQLNTGATGLCLLSTTTTSTIPAVTSTTMPSGCRLTTPCTHIADECGASQGAIVGLCETTHCEGPTTFVCADVTTRSNPCTTNADCTNPATPVCVSDHCDGPDCACRLGAGSRYCVAPCT